MEFFEGRPLRAWLTDERLHPKRLPENMCDDLTFYARWVFARLLIESLRPLHYSEKLHGDLHPDNVLVGSAVRTDRDEPTFYDRDFRVIDFGTSHFASNSFSSRRHWRVLEQCVDSIVQPLRLKPIGAIVGRRHPPLASGGTIGSRHTSVSPAYDSPGSRSRRGPPR